MVYWLEVNSDMKKRTAFIGVILSLIPLGQPLLIKTVGVLSGSAVMLSLTEKVNAESAVLSNVNSAQEKIEKEDYYGAISDYMKAIEIEPNNALLYSMRSYPKFVLKDFIGSISDLNKAIKINPNRGSFYKLRGNAKYMLNEVKSACIDWSKAASLGDKDGIPNIKKWC